MKFFEKALTIVEMIVVLLLIAILVAVGVFIPLNRSKLNAAANKLVFDLRYAQQMAISRQLASGVYFNLSTNSYYIYQNNNTSDIAKDPYTAEEFIVNYNTLPQLKGVSLVSTNFGERIYFNYLGSPFNSTGSSLSSQGRVVLRQSGQTRTVTIEPTTGQVKLP